MGTRRRAERNLEAAIVRVEQLSRHKALEDAFELTARRLFEKEREEVKLLLAEAGPEKTLEVLDRLKEEVWEPRWSETFAELMRETIGAQVRRR
jgi:hypothetical protein